ncbi:MAG: hypothetical protein QOF83_1485 [Solirubrobacteraceae bacterium]|jgi:hypothetical protein|nr:hypothetical protein [Solirubrobacteraceae bacterium]
MLALLLLAKVDNVSGGGPLTLIFPLILVFIVAVLWALSFRHFRRDL